MAAAQTYSAFPHSDIGFKPPVTNSQGSNTVYVQQRGQWAGPRPQLDGQGTPPITPFGVQTNEQNGTRSVSINVSSAALRKWCEDVDALVLQAAQSNSTAWLGKERFHTLAMFYRKLMALARGYDLLLRLKIVEWGNEKKDTKVWLQRKNAQGEFEVVRGVVDDIKPQSAIIPIVMLNNLWFIQNRLG